MSFDLGPAILFCPADRPERYAKALERSDAVVLDLEDAVASGFAATACIHPSQVAVIRQAYAPTDVQLQHARAVLAASENEHGVFAFEGQMVDEPVLRHARTVVERAR